MEASARFDRSTALVVVDLQNDFADPAGSLFIAGSELVVDEVNAAVAEALAAGAFVVATRDWHPPSTPHFAKDGGIWPVHCVAGSWGAELHPGFHLPDGAPSVHKGVSGEDGYSGFTMRHPVSGEETATDLELILRDRSIERVVACGLATDYCVKATALDALRLGFEVVVIERAAAAVNLDPQDGARALEELRAAGAQVR